MILDWSQGNVSTQFSPAVWTWTNTETAIALPPTLAFPLKAVVAAHLNKVTIAVSANKVTITSVTPNIVEIGSDG